MKISLNGNLLLLIALSLHVSVLPQVPEPRTSTVQTAVRAARL